MKKYLWSLIVMALVLGMGKLNAQEKEEKSELLMKDGVGVLNMTVGLGNALYGGYGSWYSVAVPPLAVSYEIGIMEDVFDENGSIGVGGYLGYASYKYRYNNGFISDYRISNFIIGPRGAFHYQFVEDFDTYIGVFLGANISSNNFGTITTRTPGGVLFETFLGGRYYFQENMAALGEIGFGIAYLNLGLAIRL
ncbi:hypothetical protein QWY93_17640 [Echinicola jeungdonensis]|uniref:Outer membrane protein beta-barrel domain-containing protein n=1 Tax=Echinicola jeungdonensis TaxID=709343 RepID=A0ABV5J237_9BACT|nr:hypothetical protein [Echinicola jeungdonensis]MDN3671139.1 hypothetical protein [Echinicola jeungdonensis]